MAEGFVNVTEGSGKKLHTFNRTIGANDVHDEAVILGEQYLATYGISGASSTATANDHLLQIMAGSSLKVRIRRIRIYQSTLAGAVNLFAFQVLRLTTAGTGGTTVTPQPYESADGSSGATVMLLPTTKGTEGAILQRSGLGAYAAHPITVAWEWTQLPNAKPIVIPAGTTNGIAVKNMTAVASAAVVVQVEFDESSF